MNFHPNLDYSVQLNLQKEFVRHKRIICSLKEFAGLDLQNKWDLGYCRTFCNTEDEQKGQFTG